MRVSILLSLGALLGFPALAAGQGTVTAAQPSAATCACVLTAEAGSAGAGLQDVRGRVLRASETGYAPVEADVELSAGDRILLLGNGQAVLVGGDTCRLVLAAPSITNLIRTDSGTCVAQSFVRPVQGEPGGAASVAPWATGDLLQAGGLIVTGGLVAGGVVGAVSAGAEADDPVSP